METGIRREQRRSVWAGTFAGMLIALASASYAAPVPFTGSLTFDFTPGGGMTIVGQHPAGTGMVIVNGGSGIVSPINKITIPISEFGGPGSVNMPVGTVGSPPQAFQLLIGASFVRNDPIVVQASGTCLAGTPPLSMVACPGGGLAGFGGLAGAPFNFFIDPVSPTHIMLNRIGAAPGGAIAGSPAFLAPGYFIGSFAGWTTGTVGAGTKTFVGSNTGSTISLVSPAALSTAPPSSAVTGVARLQINLQLSCGDSLISSGESCDDGNAVSGDGCSATCQLEPGFNCVIGPPTTCTAICGDGLIRGTEACDDNNATPGDGCNATCQVEPNYLCSGEPSVCVPVLTILGKQMLVKNPDPGGDATKRKVLVMAKEASSPDPLTGNPAMNGASVTVKANGTTPTSQTFTLPAGAAWKTTGTGFKYSDSSGANGPVKVALIKKSGGGTFLIKVVISAKNGAVNVLPPNLGTDGGMQFTINAGATYCVKLSGPLGSTVTNNADKLFKVKGATGQSGCP